MFSPKSLPFINYSGIVSKKNVQVGHLFLSVFCFPASNAYRMIFM